VHVAARIGCFGTALSGRRVENEREDAVRTYTPLAVDIHTRKLRYFVAVADELHFSRAAAGLYIAQQALSRQIRELEELVGTQLFVRTSRKVELTPAGAAFLEHAKATLAALDGAVDAAWRASGVQVTTLTLGFGIGAALELTEPVLTEFHEPYPEVRVELREYPFADPSAGLVDGSADLGIVRLPIAAADLEFEPLFHEPLVVALSCKHVLATRARVSMADLLDEPIAIGRTADTTWQGFWLLNDHRDGKPPRQVIHTSSHTEELQIVAAGGACSVTSAAAARFTQHPGLCYVPIEDADPSTCAIAWRRGARTPTGDRFVEVACAVRDRETAVVHAIEHPFLPPVSDEGATAVG